MFQLKFLLLMAVEEFTNLFDPSKRDDMPYIHMALVLEGSEMKIDPPVQVVEDAICHMLTTITVTLQVRLPAPVFLAPGGPLWYYRGIGKIFEIRREDL